jgi:hypothetical protein
LNWIIKSVRIDKNRKKKDKIKNKFAGNNGKKNHNLKNVSKRYILKEALLLLLSSHFYNENEPILLLLHTG